MIIGAFYAKKIKMTHQRKNAYLKILFSPMRIKQKMCRENTCVFSTTTITNQIGLNFLGSITLNNLDFAFFGKIIFTSFKIQEASL